MKKEKKAAKKRKAGYHHGDLKNTLIDAAIDIIHKDGRRALTLRGVAAAAGVSRNAPYRHYKNKEALLAAVAESGFREFTLLMDNNIREETDPLEKIIKQACAYVEFARSHPAQFEVMFRFNLMSFFGYPDLLDAASGAASRLLSSIQACQEAGIVRQGDSIKLGFGAWSMIHGLATLIVGGMFPLDIKEDVKLESIVREYAMSYLDGVRNRK